MKKIKIKIQKPDRDSHFEVLDRSYVISKMFNEILMKHPVVKRSRYLKDICNQVDLLLGDLIQAAGNDLWDIDESLERNHKK